MRLLGGYIEPIKLKCVNFYLDTELPNIVLLYEKFMFCSDFYISSFLQPHFVTLYQFEQLFSCYLGLSYAFSIF